LKAEANEEVDLPVGHSHDLLYGFPRKNNYSTKIIVIFYHISRNLITNQLVNSSQSNKKNGYSSRKTITMQLIARKNVKESQIAGFPETATLIIQSPG